MYEHWKRDYKHLHSTVEKKLGKVLFSDKSTVQQFKKEFLKTKIIKI